MNDSRINGRYATKGIENVKEWVKKCNPDMEYAGGFTDFDSFIKVRCLKCGDVFERSMGTIRHGRRTRCPNCQKIAKELELRDKERRKAERHAKVIANRPYVLARAKEKQAEKTRKRQEARLHACPVCGTITTRPKFCSKLCSAKYSFDSSKHESIRRTRIKENIADRDITLKKLFERDDGVCWICGGTCDYTDYTQTDKAFIAGNSYPSVDHVVPLSKGGLHSWDNVKLAHRLCNTKRFYSSPGQTS